MSGPHRRARSRLWWIVGAIVALPFILLIILFAAMILYGLNATRGGVQVLDYSEPVAREAEPVARPSP